VVIDCETHVFPRNYDFRRCHVEHLLADMDRCGVGKTFLMASNLRCYELAAELDNVWVCSSMPWWFRDNEANPLLNRQLRFLRDYVGFSKVTWGSDWPYNGSSRSFCFNSDYQTVVDYYRELPFYNDEEREYLLGRAAYEFVTGDRSGA